MDSLDRKIINHIQTGFPLCEYPYLVVAQQLGIDEATLLSRLQSLLDTGVLSRFGPLFNIERSGGAFSLCAMQVPAARYAEISEQVNALAEVAHNYEREHRFNMWFVLATETPSGIDRAIAKIESDSGLQVFNFPKQREFFVGLRLEV